MEKEKYLERINYKRAALNDIDTLVQLQQHHLLHVPFENLDIHSKIPIELKSEKIFDKIVNRKRGGFCYELNGLFHLLLEATGFESRMISARVYNSKEEEYSQEYDHMAIIVHVNGVDYLVDVGFGEFTFSPLELMIGEIQEDKRGKFKITNHQQDWLKVSKASGNEWIPEYIFTTKARSLSEFGDMCRYHQTSPLSQFTKNKICSLLTNNGDSRITITNNKLRITTRDELQEEIIGSDAEFENHLWNYFKIKTSV